MNKISLRYKNDWDEGTYAGTVLDTQVAISPYNHPGLVAATAVTTGSSASGAQLADAAHAHADFTGVTMNGGNAWTALPSTGGPVAPNTLGLIKTAKAGDSIDLPTTTAIRVDIQLAGYIASGLPYRSGDAGLVAGAVRNGGIVQVLVDGVLVQSVSTANARPLVSIPLDGAAHTVRIRHSGFYTSAVHPISGFLPPSGSTVVGGLHVTPVTSPTFRSASWRVTAASSSTYTVERADPVAPGGTLSYTTIGTYSTGSGHTGVVDGCTIRVDGPLTTGHVATFTTDVVMTAVESVTVYDTSIASSSSRTYTSQIFDSGDSQTQWFLAEWDRNPPFAGEALPTLRVRTANAISGETLVNATEQEVPHAAYTLPFAGTNKVSAGLMGTPAGRYAQLVFAFPDTAAENLFIRDVTLYSWVPRQGSDPILLDKMPWPTHARVGDTAQAYLGMLATAHADLYDDTLKYTRAPAVALAEDQYLLAAAADRGVLPISGEDPLATRTRLLAFTQDPGRLSIAQICRQVAILVTGEDQDVSISVAGGLTTATAAGVTVAQTGTYTYTVTIPPAPYPGLATIPITQAQAALTTHISTVLRPIGSAVTITFEG